MSLDNNSANNFKDFLDAIKPFLNYQLYDMSGMGVEAFRFSTDEKPVGQWTDGKILYQRTFSFSTGTISSSTPTDVTIASLGNTINVVNIFGVAPWGSGGSSGTNGINGVAPNNVKDGCRVTVTNGNLVFQAIGNWFSNQTALVTIQYTKTTDSPLSSDEKFAGVTSGGEVIYERTIDYGSTVVIPNSGFTSIGMDASNISMILYAYGYHTDDARCCPLIAIKESNLVKCIAARAGAGMELRYFTVRYTKSS